MAESAAQQDHHDRPRRGPVARLLDTLGSVFSHPAAGKRDPPVEDIGPVGPEKAAILHEAGYDTAREVYQADRMALADALGDRVAAGYLQHMAERTLEHSEASVLAASVPSTTPERGDPRASTPPLTDIQQIGDARARALRNAGYTTVADVTSLDTATLTTIEGISKTRAETILDSAHDLLEEHSLTGTADATGGG